MKISEIKHPHGIIEIEIACPRQKVSLLNIGATFARWLTTSNVDILARYDDITEYLVNKMYLGVTVGPNAGRLKNGHFELNNKEYQMLEKESHFLHSGEFGYSRTLFDYKIISQTDLRSEILFSLDYQHPLIPGRQNINVTYVIEPDHVHIEYHVTSDQLSLCNITNHAYMNIDGDFEHEISTHSLQLNASKVLMIDENLIGSNFIDVQDTVFDFRKETLMMPSVEAIKVVDKDAFGIDHYFLFDNPSDTSVHIYSRQNNHHLEITSDYPGTTVYTTNFPSDKHVQTNKALPLHSAFCVEPEYIGDSINRNDCEKGIVSNEKPYHHQIDFYWRKEN